MKWITHQIGAGLGAAIIGLPAQAIACALAGAVLPDLLDQRMSRMAGRGRQKVFNRIHRGASHWFGWYAALLALAAAWPNSLWLGDCALGFALGAISHVALDLLTPQGVPLLPFTRKVRLAAPLCSTGRWSEYVFLALMCLAGGWYLLQPVPWLG